MSADKPKRPRKAGTPRFPAPPRLVLVCTEPARPRPAADSERRALLDDVRRRERVHRNRLNNDDGPEAA